MAEDASRVLSILEQLAPLELAENWDNVGLIVDPREAGDARGYEHAFLTIDLTASTFAEAIACRADLIVAYHPPIFGGLKRLRHRVPSERVILEAVARGLTIYSPHTALDAAREGMGDWLAAACGPGDLRPITPSSADPAVGAGRLVTLHEPISFDQAVERIKAHLGLSHVRVAAPEPPPPIRTLAVCPGAGGTLFQGVHQVDLLLTGELRHHDVVARRAAGTAVVLTDHTNSERGYLPVLAQRMRTACPGLEVTVSERDVDPLAVV